MGWLSSVGSSGNNIRGRIVQGQNGWGCNIQGRNIQGCKVRGHNVGGRIILVPSQALPVLFQDLFVPPRGSSRQHCYNVSGFHQCLLAAS
jgi:hypothetical protein